MLPSDALARAHEAGLGVIVKEALANGRLAAREGGNDERLLTVARERGQPPMLWRSPPRSPSRGRMSY